MSNDNNDIQWYEFHDDSGKPYYHNPTTKETTWFAPISGYIKSNNTTAASNTTTASNTSSASIKKRQRDDDDDDDDDYGDSNYNTTIAVSNTDNVYGNWDDDDDFDDEYDHNNTYNNITGTTTNDDTKQETTPIGTTPIGTPPSGTPSPSGTPIDDDDDYDYNNYNTDDDNNKQQDNNDDMYINDDDDHDNNDEDTINNEEQRKLNEIKELEDKLNAVDAIVNTDINATIQRLVQLSDDPSVMAKKISNSLSENYVGYAQMTHVLLEWLHIAQEADKATSSSSSSSIQNIVIEDQETVAVNELAEIIKEMFNKDKADELIKLFVTSHEASEWFTKLIEDPILRRTLIELYDKNKGSTLLAHSIKMLSSMGYNREIAQIVREVDYIEVFNELLIDLISRVVQSNDDDLQSLAEDLKRMCCHTDFMFAYSHYLLIYIEQLLLLDNTIEADFEAAAQTDESEQDKQRRESLNMMLWGDDDDDETEQTVKVQEQSIKSIYDGKKVQSVRHKIRRLREELELTAIWKKRETVSGRLTNVGQFGLKLIGLQKLSTDTTSSGQNLTASVWYELLDMLKSNSISTIHVDRLTGYYFKGNNTIVDSSQLQQMTVPVCFLREPQVMYMLIDALIHPSKQLATSSIKIARLLALAYCYDDGSHKDNTDLMYYGFLGSKAKAKIDISTKDYDRIAKELIELEASLLKIRELCDGIIKMAYSVLSFDKPYKIVELMVNPLVSMCVIRYYH